ncbi:hypothetical protein ALC152_09140 [Arcobacter sp. 15-2]
MIVEKFSIKILQSRIFDIYVATVFFASAIFFVLNSSIFTPLEMMFGIVFSTIIFKGVANIMLSMTISLINLDNQHDLNEFKKSSDDLESLVNDLAIQEASIQSNKNNKNV